MSKEYNELVKRIDDCTEKILTNLYIDCHDESPTILASGLANALVVVVTAASVNNDLTDEQVKEQLDFACSNIKKRLKISLEEYRKKKKGGAK